MDPATRSPDALASLIGFVAGTLTTISFLPQVIRTWKRRSASDLSMLMLIVYIAGVFGWILYGIVTKAPPVIITNTVSEILALVLLGMKIRFD